MTLATCLLWTLAVCAGCQGLQMTFSVDGPVTPGGRAACGVLLCEEVTSEPTNTTSDQSDTADSARSISEMSVLKHAQSDDSAGGRDRLIATLTSQQPRIRRVSDGMKVDGGLSAGRATLRLEVYKQEDCRAQYTCHVTQIDAQGRRHVTSSRLQQQRSEGGGLQTDGARWSPAVAIKLLSLLHQMDGKLDQVAMATDDSWKLRIQALENRLEDKLALMENRLEDKVGSIENRVENKFDSFENRLESKMASFKKSLQDERKDFQKELSDKLSDQMSVSLSGLSSLVTDNGSQLVKVVRKTIDESLGTLQQDMKTMEDKVLANVDAINKNLHSNLNSTTSRISAIENNLTSLQTGSGDNKGCLKSLEDAISNISITALNSAQLVEDQLAWVDQRLQKQFQQLVSDVNNNTVAGLSDIHDILVETQTNISDSLQTAITDTLTLRRCRKDAISVLPHPPFPYPVVHPDRQNPVEFPHLCDTLTDGGGWLVIQRRSTGNVHFYRTWAEYKTGFGSLDDDFWLGNDRIHAITNSGTYELRVDLKYSGKSRFAHYSSFSISDEKSNYTLHLGTYDGTAGDSLRGHKGLQFSTHDRDNDGSSSGNCAQLYTGAWWYSSCHDSNLNGKWGAGKGKGPCWDTFTSTDASSFTEMKIRRVDSS